VGDRRRRLGARLGSAGRRALDRRRPRGLELGLNWIDTAAACGFERSESVVGRALAGVEDRPCVFAKCGLLPGPGGRVVNSLGRDSLRREREAGLARLGVDAIDLYQIHWPRPDEDLEEAWSTSPS
jgi:aryl-alcohol dehydrogenase-like predicted oxidoreductase